MNRRDFFGASFVAAALVKGQAKEAVLWTPDKEIIAVPATATEPELRAMIYGGPNAVSFKLHDGTEFSVPFQKFAQMRMHWSPIFADVELEVEDPRFQDITSMQHPYLARQVIAADREFAMTLTPKINGEGSFTMKKMGIDD